MSRTLPVAAWRMAASASASLMVMKASMQPSRKRHASGDSSRQSRPAMIESPPPAAMLGLPARALWYRQSAFSGSTTIRVGRFAPKYSHR